MTSILLSGGTLVDASEERRGDVLITDGRIVETGPVLDAPTDATVVDADGLLVLPGLVDLHTHVREPGREEAETIETAARGAALGGFTAIVAMPSTTPTIDSPSIVRDVLAIAADALCDIVPAAALTVGRAGEQLTPMGELAAMGIRIFSDAGKGVQDPALMRRIMEYATGLTAIAGGRPLVLAQHPSVAALATGHMHEGTWSTKLGIPGQPVEAETLLLMRDIALVRRTGARLHVQHISCAESVDLVRQAKAEGLPVTAEVTPEHLTLTDAECASYNPVFKVEPPLRTQLDVDALRSGLADGTIDAIATCHAPHEPHTKEFPFDQAPAGMLGLETALAVALTHLDLPLTRLVTLLSTRPAEIAGVDDRHGRPVAAGEPANLCLVDPAATWTVSGVEMASRSHNTPWEGRELQGRVRHTIRRGEFTVIDGKATA